MNDVRSEYRPLSEADVADVQMIKNLGQQFIDHVSSIGTSRELSLAKTKAEEAVMWAVKHVTR